MRKLILVGFVLIGLMACEDDRKTVYEIDDELIQEYLTKHNIAATKHSSNMYYLIEKEGSDPKPKRTDNVEYSCVGYFLDGFVFRENTSNKRGNLSTFTAGEQYGLPLFGKGGKGKLFIPRNLAYNNEVIVLEIELLNVW